MRVDDLLRQGQGVLDHTFFGYARIRRFVGAERKTHFLPVNLDAAISDETSADNLALGPEDELTVFSQAQLDEVPTVTVEGSVRNAGTYPLIEGMKISDLIYEAGGLKDSAYQGRAELARAQVVNGSAAHYLDLKIDLRNALVSGGAEDVLLQPHDKLFVQEASNWHPIWQIQLKGEVLRPGPYVIHEGERLTEVLRDCGGFRPDAYPPAAIFIRKSVKEMQQQSLDQARAELQQQVAMLSTMKGSGGSDQSQSGGSSGSLSNSLMMAQQLLAQSESQQAVGRVVIRLSSLDAVGESADHLVLQDDDQLIIPKQPGSVNILGQVYNPTSIAYQPGLRMRDYLRQAGGPTELADAENTFVIRADGSILTDKLGKTSIFPLLSYTGGRLTDSHLELGDTVYVPPKIIYVNNYEFAKDMAQIISSSAMVLAFVAIAGTKL